MKRTLGFSVSIRAPRALVWQKMLGDAGYRLWTAPFCDGSYYDGSWDKGAKIRFLSPRGDGMTAEIAENRLHEYISIRHLGEIAKGVEDTKSDKVRAWAPAYENYTFADTGGGTTVTVTVEALAGFEQFMQDTFPGALERLRLICERPA